MKTDTQSANHSFSNSVHQLEKHIARIAAYSLRIYNDDGSLNGICLLAADLQQEKREAIEKAINRCKGITVEKSGSDKTFNKKISLLPAKKKSAKDAAQLSGYEYFIENLEAVSHHAALTRIPFSVLLIQPCRAMSSTELKYLSDTIRDNLNYEDIFSVYEAAKIHGNKGRKGVCLAVIIPSAGLSKARKRAEEIRQAVFASPGVSKKKQGLSVGLGVSYAGECIGVREFLLSVEKHLQEAAAIGDCISWEKGRRSANSCQVTAEERAQLFGQLK
jgi:hypothetical protein